VFNRDKKVVGICAFLCAASIVVQLEKIFIDTLESLELDVKIFDDINKFLLITAE
jgi:hypothetical protein